MVEQFLHSKHVIALTPTTAPTLRTRRGGLVPAASIDGVYTTPNMLAAEQRLLDLATQPSTTLTADHRHIEHAIARRGTLSDEQVAMVRAICASTAGVDIVEGVAGAGKTFALAAANDAWTGSGLRVRGACLAARAADQLQTGSGIPSSTLDRLLRDLDSEDPLTNRDIVVIDEAAMVGTRTLARLLEHARRANAKVVLIGHPASSPRSKPAAPSPPSPPG